MERTGVGRGDEQASRRAATAAAGAGMLARVRAWLLPAARSCCKEQRLRAVLPLSYWGRYAVPPLNWPSRYCLGTVLPLSPWFTFSQSSIHSHARPAPAVVGGSEAGVEGEQLESRGRGSK